MCERCNDGSDFASYLFQHFQNSPPAWNSENLFIFYHYLRRKLLKRRRQQQRELRFAILYLSFHFNVTESNPYVPKLFFGAMPADFKTIVKFNNIYLRNPLVS